MDATDDNTANVLIGYAQAVVQGYSSDIQVDWLRDRGQTAGVSPLSVQTRTWYNEDLESSAFIVPGVLALVMSVIGAFLTSLTTAREWERGTMEQLVSTPVTPFEIMFGKLVPYFVIGMLDVIICALIALLWFHVPFRGSFVTLLVSSAMFMIVVLSMGFFISVIAKNQLAASQVALLTTFLPAFLLSGFLYAIEQMPVVLQWITRILPARYYVSALKKIFLKGTPTTLLYADLVPLAIFTVVLARLKQMLIKEFIQVFRDKRTRFVLFGPPIIQMLIFGYAATFEIHHVPTAVLDLDHSQESREFISRFTSSPYFDVQRQLTDYRQVGDLIDRGEVTVALRINPGFAQNLRKGQTAPVQVIVDATNSNTALIASGYINQIALGFARDYQQDRIQRISPFICFADRHHLTRTITSVIFSEALSDSLEAAASRISHAALPSASE